MTNWDELTPEEKEKVKQDLEIDGQKILQGIKAGNTCARCYKSYYNCICTQEDL